MPDSQPDSGKKTLKLTPDPEIIKDPDALKQYLLGETTKITDLLADPTTHTLEISIFAKHSQMTTTNPEV